MYMDDKHACTLNLYIFNIATLSDEVKQPYSLTMFAINVGMLLILYTSNWYQIRVTNPVYSMVSRAYKATFGCLISP